MAKRNFLLGKGEVLTSTVTVKSGGGPKAAPYTFGEAKRRLQPMLNEATEALDALPADACPQDNAIVTLVLNPEYLAKSYFPKELLDAVGLEAVGSRTRRIKPEKRSRGRKPEEVDTTELFLQGPRKAIREWTRDLGSWQEGRKYMDEIASIERLEVPSVKEKLKQVPARGKVLFEVVLHASNQESTDTPLKPFRSYLKQHNLPDTFERQFNVGGLYFVELEATAGQASQIAEFTMVRVVRKMPDLRLLRPAIKAVGIESIKVDLPKSGPVDKEIKVAIFDGGIPKQHPITRWATPIDVPGIGSAHPGLLAHGVGVTSALLFGHIDPKKPVSVPYTYVDHYRVLDTEPGSNPYELYEVLARIDKVLRQKKYMFINLSLGPNLPVEDDEVHAWTAVLDAHLAKGNILATIAVGNDGEGNPLINANRVQVPADCVNALAIGACDVPDKDWQRAPYSSVGPGRSPGLIKPDLVDFGGSVQRPFLVLDAKNGSTLTPTGGTSFAAPSTQRMGTGVRAHFGASLSPLAIRALLVHCAEPADIPFEEIGWGRVARELNDIVVSSDHAARIVFQGKISAAKYIRAPIPIPDGVLNGKVTIKATVCYATQVDPHHPANYTRSGLEIVFRPNRTKFSDPKSEHPATKSFFGKTQSGMTEDELRRDAWKWENCLHAEQTFFGTTLNNPVFDMHYNARIESHNDTREQEMDYALVITVEAPKIKDMYDQVLRKYATRLQALQPVIDIPLRL